MQIESMIHEWQPDLPSSEHGRLLENPGEQRKWLQNTVTTKGGMVLREVE
jgi:hypothetical protein